MNPPEALYPQTGIPHFPFGGCGIPLYERGCQTIPVEHLLILADFCGVSADYIPSRTNNLHTAE